MPLKLKDLSQELQITTRKSVGGQRWQRPNYVDFLPPCNHACPAGGDIQGWLSHAQGGDFEKAWQTLVENNPLPATHGRACYHPCERGCNRGHLDEPVAIHAIERFLGDLVAEKGWQVPVKPPTGKTERLAADSVVLAVGQHADLSLFRGAPGVKVSEHGTVVVDDRMMTGQPGLFAGGDVIGGARTMTAAVGHGKLAARNIDAWLRGESYRRPASNPPVSFDMLHLPGYLEAPRTPQRELALGEREGFAEIVTGFDEPTARYEAQRCLSCGNCFE